MNDTDRAITLALKRKPAVEGAFFCEKTARKAIEFFPKYIRLTEGRWAGKPFDLLYWQKLAVAEFFGWKCQNEGSRIVRVYRRLIIWIPRKNGKTEFMAGIALLVMVGDNEGGVQGYSIAKDKSQAELVFNKMAAMITLSPELSKWLTPFKQAISCPRLRGFFKPLSGQPDGKHGLSAHLVCGDEVHEWKDKALCQFVHQSTGAREQPVEIYISTAGTITKGYGYEFWEESQKIQKGIYSDPRSLIIVYAATDQDDWADEATWRKANPSLGHTLSLDYFRAEFKKAQENPLLENDFRRYHLNQWVGQETRWVPLEMWDKNRDTRFWGDDPSRCWSAEKEALLIERLRGRPCYGGIDLSSTRDLSALVWIFPPQEEGERTILLPRFWLPQETIAKRVNNDRVEYDLWIKQGALRVTTGNVVDYDFIEQCVLDDAQIFDVRGVGVDPFNATQFTVSLNGRGINVEMVRQSYLNISPPMKELERLVFCESLDHGGHPVLRWNMWNMAFDTDPNGNIKPAKNKAREKIDGIVAAIMGIGLMNRDAAPPAPSVYEERGFIII